MRARFKVTTQYTLQIRSLQRTFVRMLHVLQKNFKENPNLKLHKTPQTVTQQIGLDKIRYVFSNTSSCKCTVDSILRAEALL
jgi:hypothetical protein